MSKRSFTTPRAWSMRPALTISLVTCLLLLAGWHFRGVRPEAVRPAQGAVAESAAQNEVGGDRVEQSALPKLEGAEARAYLEKTSDGQSLMKVLTAERFGLELKERSPFDKKSGAGYLGMSHDQNLNAWFDEGGITVRPTLSEKERDRAWRLGFRLKSYGYGARLTAAPPIVSHRVKENRIEYERGAEETGARVTEWYENQSAGIEQGFTLSARPERGGEVGADEPLRLLVGVTGGLRARAKEEGQAIELSRQSGETVLSYSKLTALDADGRKLAARMEASADGGEIALVVDDRDAIYPIVIDPITASLEQPLYGTQVDSRFGFSVAIEGGSAVVGAWREDIGGFVDSGSVYLFTRSGSNWSLNWRLLSGLASNASCGWSVAISRSGNVVFGCPGVNTQSGRAYLRPNIGGLTDIATSDQFKTGDQFGYSVAISETRIVVGAPFVDNSASLPDTGGVYTFIINPDGSVTQGSTVPGDVLSLSPRQLGASVAIDGNIIIAGAPGAGAGRAFILELLSGGNVLPTALQASDGEAGDNFGNSVDISGNTAVVGAYGDDDRGTDAGAAYVFVRNASGQWSQQQKLTSNSSRAGDHFSEHAVAVQGNTIVVGAYAWDFLPDDNAGAVYIYTRSGTVWTPQTELQGGSAYNYGIGVDISGNSVIIGARAADAPGITRAGTAYVYRLDCVPPYDGRTTINNNLGFPQSTFCPGASVFMYSGYTGDASIPVTFQWRKNGANIPGATSQNYSIGSVSALNEGTYDVIISSSCGSEISSPSTLTVYSFSLNPTSQNFGASGSNSVVNVNATGSCSWTAARNVSWITITSGASGAGNGSVGFTVAANTGAGQRTGTLTIAGQTFTVTQDGTAPPTNTFQFGQSAYTVGEGAGSATITVTRAGDLSAAATVEYATTDGAATDRGDYNTTIGRLRFAAGESAKTFSVLVTDDAYAEGTESLNLTLSNPAGGPALASPSVASLSINDNDAVNSASNPIDSTPFFVRQQYVDFFSREPDAPGLSFWSGGIDSCGANAGCREVKRIDTSAAFFLSIEFQETGFLVHRLYRVAFNRLARYREFVRDTQEIGRGVVVNSPGWEAQLEANKATFLNEFAARADFQALYNPLTNAQYVDALNANSAGSLSQAERDSLVAGLNASTETRATVLRKVADDADLRARETSPAFVLMQYFGYLRRNPDDAPDTDFAGYNFWLGKLNEFGGDYRRAEMVKAFLVSTEYRKRFAP